MMTEYHAQQLRNLRKKLNIVLRDEPDDDELEYDECLIGIYEEVHNLDEALKDNGF